MEPDARLLLRWEANANPAGFALDHPYVEAAWLPVLGPSCVAVLRRLAALQVAFPNSVEVGAAEFVRQLGLGSASGASSSFWRALGRLDHFDLVTWDPDARTLTAPHQVPPLTGAAPGPAPRHDPGRARRPYPRPPTLQRRPASPSTPPTGLRL